MWISKPSLFISYIFLYHCFYLTNYLFFTILTFLFRTEFIYRKWVYISQFCLFYIYSDIYTYIFSYLYISQFWQFLTILTISSCSSEFRSRNSDFKSPDINAELQEKSLNSEIKITFSIFYPVAETSFHKFIIRLPKAKTQLHKIGVKIQHYCIYLHDN